MNKNLARFILIFFITFLTMFYAYAEKMPDWAHSREFMPDKSPIIYGYVSDYALYLYRKYDPDTLSDGWCDSRAFEIHKDGKIVPLQWLFASWENNPKPYEDYLQKLILNSNPKPFPKGLDEKKLVIEVSFCTSYDLMRFSNHYYRREYKGPYIYMEIQKAKKNKFLNEKQCKRKKLKWNEKEKMCEIFYIPPKLNKICKPGLYWDEYQKQCVWSDDYRNKINEWNEGPKPDYFHRTFNYLDYCKKLGVEPFIDKSQIKN